MKYEGEVWIRIWRLEPDGHDSMKRKLVLRQRYPIDSPVLEKLAMDVIKNNAAGRGYPEELKISKD